MNVIKKNKKMESNCADLFKRFKKIEYYLVIEINIQHIYEDRRNVRFFYFAFQKERVKKNENKQTKIMKKVKKKI